MPLQNVITIRRLQRLMDMTDLMVGDDAIAQLLEEIARVLEQTVGVRGRGDQRLPPPVGRLPGHQRPRAARDARGLIGRPTTARMARGGARRALRPARRVLHPGGLARLGGGRHRRPLRAGARRRPSPTTVAGAPATSCSSPAATPTGEIPAVISLGEPVFGRPPSDTELDFLVAVGRHCGAPRSSRPTTPPRPARHRAALEHLLAVSSKARREALDRVGHAGRLRRRPSRRWGFQKVVIELVDPARRPARAARVRRLARRGNEPRWEVPDRAYMAPAACVLEFELGGCYLLPYEGGAGAHGLGGVLRGLRVPERNGRGPRAWNRHRLYVPLRDATGAVVGRIWADEPEDLLLPVARPPRGARACSPARRRWRWSPPASSSSCASSPTRIR